MLNPLLSAPVITADMLAPLTEGITANIGVILPVCVGIMAIFIGVGLIPQLINKFKKA